MYDVVIFGTGKTSKIVKTGLNEEVNIVAYCDNDSSKWYKEINGIRIIPPDELKNISYDYIIIASQYNESIYKQLLNMGISKEKLFEFFKYVNTSYNVVMSNLNKLLKSSNNDVETLITGISYAQRGIDTSIFRKKAYNLACGSQDLYYDYHIIKYLLENHKEHFRNVKNIIIGLCYYSFEYDMSLSAMQNRVCFYYEAIGLEHHGSKRDLSNQYRNEKLKVAKRLFKCDNNGMLIVDFLYDKNNVCKINEEIGKKQAFIDGNKNYPETVKENIQIFNDYLKLLKENDIRPIVVIFPLTRYYRENFSESLKDEFYNIIENIKLRYNFEFLDYSKNHDFVDDEFYDVSHLNSKGAARFSKLIDDFINN